MTRDETPDGPMKARADLVDMLSADPKITKSIVSIIEGELKDIQDKDVFDMISRTLEEAASQAGVESEARDNVLYWLTETTPDVREMILVRTIEDLLKSKQTREATLDALAKVSSKENVELVIEWVNSNILTLNQAVYVLLYPDSSAALK
ncbi:MAG: hypothetical protein EAX95_12540 [Candidatus Thorarchaeota archaeon]|nr:hypothetical protein [Candidatus Thorarchaeota archaeon]